MAMKFYLIIIAFLVGFTVSPCMVQSKMWCMVKVSAPDAKLTAFLNSNCGKFDCRPIRPGGSCYQPNTLQGHASYVLDVVYRATGSCNPDIGTTAVGDPSYGGCHYP